MSVEPITTSPTCTRSRLLRRAAVFLALGLSGFFFVPELAAQTAVYYSVLQARLLVLLVRVAPGRSSSVFGSFEERNSNR
jgi:hypothetical protein